MSSIRDSYRGLALWCLTTFILVALLVPGLARAGGGEAPLFVTPPAKPTVVKIGVYVVAVTRVDPPAEAYPTFEAEVFLDLVWQDPRLAFDPDEVGTTKEVFLEHEAELKLERIWWPDVGFENAQGARKVSARELVIKPDGMVEYSERSHGTFSFAPDLRRFPFDAQIFKLKLESFAWNEDAVVLELYEAKTGHDEKIELQEWELEGFSTSISSKHEVRSATPFSVLTVQLAVERDSGFYLWKIVLPLLIIVIFNWSTFWMPGEDNSVRLERAFIALLTVVAFHQIVAGNLPRISYLTFMDSVVLLAFASVGLTMVSIMVCQAYHFDGKIGIVRQINRHARWAFPSAFTLAMVGLWFAYH